MNTDSPIAQSVTFVGIIADARMTEMMRRFDVFQSHGVIGRVVNLTVKYKPGEVLTAGRLRALAEVMIRESKATAAPLVALGVPSEPLAFACDPEIMKVSDGTKFFWTRDWLQGFGFTKEASDAR